MSDQRTALEKVPQLREISPAQPDNQIPVDHLVAYGYNYGYGDYDDGGSLNYSWLRKWWHAIANRKWLVIGITVIVTAATALEMFRTRSKYQASSIIEIRKENTSVVKSGDQIITNEDSLKTKASILKSAPLLEDVILNLKLDKDPKTLETGKRSIGETLSSIFYTPGAEDQRQTSQPELEEVMAPMKERSELSSEESLRLEPFVDMVKENLTVEEIKDTRLVRILFTHTDPAIAAAFCNGLAQNFIQSNFESKTDKFAKASDWLDRATQELKEKVRRAEQALTSYTAENGIFSTGTGENLAVEKLTRLHGEVMRAESERMVKESLYEEVRQGRVAQVPESFSDPKTVALQKKLGELEITEAQLSVNYGPQNPQVIEVKQQISTIQRQIEANQKAMEEKLRADYARALRDEQQFRNALEQAKVEALKQNQAAVQYNILKEELDMAKTLYASFLQKTDQTNFEVVQQQNNVRIVEPAQVPRSAIGPNRWQTISLGFFVSLMASIGIALILEFLDDRIKSVEDVHHRLQLPALGAIPTASSHRQRLLPAKGRRPQPSRDQLMALDNHSIVAEAYRVLRTSVVLSSTASLSKSILVTSTQPGDGKTTTVVNTAISLAQHGAKVLIIDCDLRTPTAHKLLGVEQGLGLSTYLSGDVEIDGLIQEMEIPNLSLLPCGPPPSNPTEIIGSQKMKDMLQTLGERYDHILIDSPPLINLADPIMLSTLVDGVVLVVQRGKTSPNAIRRAQQELSSAGARLFGVVLNKVKPSRDGYGYY